MMRAATCTTLTSGSVFWYLFGSVNVELYRHDNHPLMIDGTDNNVKIAESARMKVAQDLLMWHPIGYRYRISEKKLLIRIRRC